MAVDTSVVVAAFASWHESHGPCRRAMRQRPTLPAPCALETYAVLTRLPPPHRAPAGLVRDFLSASFPHPYLVLPPERVVALLRELADEGITGGATYDAQVAAVTLEAGATLLSLDRHAAVTYLRMGVTVEYLA